MRKRLKCVICILTFMKLICVYLRNLRFKQRRSGGLAELLVILVEDGFDLLEVFGDEVADDADSLGIQFALGVGGSGRYRHDLCEGINSVHGRFA